MPQADEIILLHGNAPYDAAKRHQYYLRTRHLKGRPSSGGDRNGGRPATVTPIGEAKSKQAHAEVAARVDELKSRLAHLESVLRTLVDAAKKRSGIDTKDQAAKKDTSKPKAKDKPKTAAEKKKAAEDERKRLAKETGRTTLSAQEQALQRDIAAVREKIAKARDDLKASVDRARSSIEKSQSKTASGR